MTETHTHAWGTQPEMFGPRHEYRLGLLLRETAKLGPSSKVLDAAVGLGQLARRVGAQGHRVFGIDNSFDAALYARRSNGALTVVGDLTKLPFRAEVFDGVTSGETLEHLDDDRTAVKELARVMKKGGTCVATVPALQVLWSASDDYYEHRRRYSRSALTTMFSDASFDVRKASFWGFPIVLVYDTLFLLPMNRRRARRDVSSDTALQSAARAGRWPALVRLVRAVFSLDRLFSFIPFGPGLLLVARKNG
ncbi:MAG TPA: class I SAM-dependent methyltransferase [Thermoanaerobaculia bacterium]|nr:class I SAM-dependent methyltransferase [Thermoanaerobaculia bacterium]